MNPLERKHYTSCVCIVVTDKGDIINAVELSGWSLLDEAIGQSILWGFKRKWGDERPFLTCICGGDDTESYDSAMKILELDCLGAWPLIVIVGHTSPGSDTIQTVEKGASYDVLNVAKAAKRFMFKCRAVTVYLSSCDSGNDGPDGDSIQKRFDEHCMLSLPGEVAYFSIATLSGSAPIPFLGTVAASGLRFTYQGIERDSEQEQREYEMFVRQIFGD